MDETSWQVKLAKSNINITNVQFNPNHKTCTICYEFPYHPKPGQVKWLKTANEFFKGKASIEGLEEIMNNGLPMVYLGDDIANSILKNVLEIRKSLEV